MVAQSFLYNSVFFTFGLIIANFYHVPNEQVGLYLFPLAIGNFCGPLLLELPFIRHRRPQSDDCRHLCNEWRTLACHRLHVRRWLAFCHYSDNRLVHHILFCISCRQFRLPHSKRNISPRNASAGHCLLLRTRHRHRRQHFAPSIRLADPESGSAWRVSFGYAIAALLLLLAAVTELKLGVDAEGKNHSRGSLIRCPVRSAAKPCEQQHLSKFPRQWRPRMRQEGGFWPELQSDPKHHCRPWH